MEKKESFIYVFTALYCAEGLGMYSCTQPEAILQRERKGQDIGGISTEVKTYKAKNYIRL